MKFQLRALTDIWTGGADGRSERLHVTGIKGSMRWWYEAVVRGLGRYACDPASHDKDQTCVLDANRVKDAGSLRAEIRRSVCPVCHLFGCTGWSGKLGVTVRRSDARDNVISGQIKANDQFVISLAEHKRVNPAERTLLQITMQVIATYGAIGAKTAFKPSEIRAKNTKLHHRDFGIITASPIIDLPIEPDLLDQVNKYLETFPRVCSLNDPVWPDLRNFWFVKGAHIDRVQHNSMVGRDDSGRYSPGPSDSHVFLGGFIGREKGVFRGATRTDYKDSNAASKKVFSFHGGKPGDPVERCFGYTRKEERDGFVKLLKASVPAISRQGVILGNSLLGIRD